jgi:hypothetical protein
MTSKTSWYCPLYKNEISAGRCLDINYERIGLIHCGMFDEVTQATGIQETQIGITCINCPNQPLRHETPTAGQTNEAN